LSITWNIFSLCHVLVSLFRVIIVIQLEILQTDCTLIGIPTIYEATTTQPCGISCSGGLGNHEPCVLSWAQQVGDNLSCFPGQGMLNSSSDLQYDGCCGSVLPQNTVYAKMAELSLDYLPNKGSQITIRTESFGPGGSSGCSLLPSDLLLSQMCRDKIYVAMDEASCPVIPVATLNPYKLKWTIKARVTAKSDLRHYGNARGPGKVFSFDLLDAQGGEIRATCFNLQVDQFFDLIEVDKVYLISRGTLKPAQKKYNPLNSDYDILVDNSTSIEVCSDDDSSIPRQQYDFRQISEIEKMENGSLVDLLVVVTSVCPSATIMRKDGTGTQKRALQVKDMSDRSVEM
jgi:replication factor A1